MATATRLGLKLSTLNEISKLFETQIGADKWATFTTTDVSEKCVKPLIRHTRMPFCEFLKSKNIEGVADATGMYPIYVYCAE